MGAYSIKTTKEVDLFLLQKRLDLERQGIKIKGNNHIISYLIEQAMKKANGK